MRGSGECADPATGRHTGSTLGRDRGGAPCRPRDPDRRWCRRNARRATRGSGGLVARVVLGPRVGVGRGRNPPATPLGPVCPPLPPPRGGGGRRGGPLAPLCGFW